MIDVINKAKTKVFYRQRNKTRDFSFLQLLIYLLRTPRIYLMQLRDRQRRSLLVFGDIFILVLSTYIAFMLRFDTLLPLDRLEQFKLGIIATIGLKILLFYLFGIYRPLLRHSGLEILEIILKVTFLTDGLIIGFSIIFAPTILPRTVQFIGAFIAIFLILNLRLAIRSLIWRTSDVTMIPRKLESRFRDLSQSQIKPKQRLLVYGAGVTGYQVAHTLNIEQDYDIVGFIDDNPDLHGRELSRKKIYAPQMLAQLIETCGVDEVLLAIPSASPKRRKEIIGRLQHLPIKIKTVPSAQEIVSGHVRVSKLRNLDISDLLGREEVPPDPNLLKANIANKIVFVSGAGGSIGAEICRQIAQWSPRALILFDLSEYALYNIDLELKEQYPALEIISMLGSVTDQTRLREIFTRYQVQTIYHAAAYKHVPLVEHNPAQGVLNNTLGTMVVAQMAQICQVETFVLISTDKAVRPTNVMGATKRAAELILQALAANPRTTTRYIMVRFGNVLGSSGSVVPRFRKQIAQGQPITLTHRDVTRYFMTIPEAARLVIQAGAMGEGGEVFLLDMGEPIKIYDLAEQMIKLSGLTPGRDIEIQITGLRPGEKLYEELLISGEHIFKTQHPKIYAAHEDLLPWAELEPSLQNLFAAAKAEDPQRIKTLLADLVSGYQPRPSTLSNFI
jgi:FlaA1/EpsC-like NDP-sugar epimerase